MTKRPRGRPKKKAAKKKAAQNPVIWIRVSHDLKDRFDQVCTDAGYGTRSNPTGNFLEALLNKYEDSEGIGALIFEVREIKALLLEEE